MGHSLLVHQLDNDTSGFDLMLSFRTSTPDGLIFYTGHKDQIMIAGKCGKAGFVVGQEPLPEDHKEVVWNYSLID